jgi:hypothetical protein
MCQLQHMYLANATSMLTHALQEDADVSRDSLTPDGQPAYWSQRYRLRGAVTAGPAGSRSSQHDVPEFLNSSKEAIVVTGENRLCMGGSSSTSREHCEQ